MSTRYRVHTVVALALGVIVFACSRSIGAQQAADATREARWHEDLGVLGRDFPARQLDFEKLYPGDRFKVDLAAIERSVPQASDADVALALMRLVASAHVGHTTVRLPAGTLHRLPIGLSWFSDGLGVVSASEAYRAALGLRVTRLGALTPETIEAAVAPYISFEHPAWLHQLSPASMVTVEILKQIDQLEGGDHLNVTLARPDGTSFVMAVKTADATVPPPTLITAADALHVPTALFRQHPEKNYWREYLGNDKVLYIQYNRCQDDPAQPFAAFAADLFGFADSHPIDGVVVDLRLNTGGNSEVIHPLVAGLKARPALRAHGHLFALIGPLTFSSGLIAAMDLRHDLHAVLVGEPPGEKPNSYGEVREITLSNSKIAVQYSTKFFRTTSGDPADFAPDVRVSRTLADALAGRDPILDAALNYQGR
jgi:hypothetical protein